MISWPQRLQQVPGRIYLLIAVVIFAAANSITRKVTDIGAQHLIEGRNPISFCNVLFVGNLIALGALLLVHGAELNPRRWRGLGLRTWLSLGLIAILSGALAPTLFFLALERTSVNTVILVGRIEPPLALALAVLLLGARVNCWVVAGSVASFVGVALTLVLQPPSTAMVPMGGLMIGRGDLMALGGAVAAATAAVASKASLRQVPLGLFNLVRTALGTVVFFIAVIVLYNPHHFQDAFSPFVWRWMLGYGLIIVAGGQLTWFQGLRTSQTAEVALANALNPLVGILAAWLILAEAPTRAQYIGGAVVLVGIALTLWGSLQPSVPKGPISPPEAASGMGFKGI
ncbi:MAG: DMT family transporter [Nodosilinea sp.]